MFVVGIKVHPLLSRFSPLISAGLLIYKMIRGEFNLSLETSNFTDLIIIILAMYGLLFGISIPKIPISDSAPTDAVTSRSISVGSAESGIAPPARTQTDEQSKNEGD